MDIYLCEFFYKHKVLVSTFHVSVQWFITSLVFPMCLMEDDKSSTHGEFIEVPKIVQQVKGLTKKGDLKLM